MKKTFVRLHMGAADESEEFWYLHGITTNAADEKDFWQEFGRAMAVLCCRQPQEKLCNLLETAGRQSFEIVAKIRGYKSSVEEHRILSTGPLMLLEDCATYVTNDDWGRPVASEPEPEPDAVAS